MNAKRQQAELHKREMLRAKERLLEQVNLKLRSYREQGYEAQAVPQIERLIALDKYRARDVQKMQELAANPDKLNEYVFAVDPRTDEVVAGEKAIERFRRYAQSSLYRSGSYDITEYMRGGLYALPHEADIMVQNVAEELEKAFVDETALLAFRAFIDDLLKDPASVTADYFDALHPDWGKLDPSELRYAVDQMMKDNINNVFTIRSALETLVVKEGAGAVSKRISDNWATLQQECITAAIGYKSAASLAMQTVLKIFLPSDRQPGNIRHRISDMQDLYDSQFDDFEE